MEDEAIGGLALELTWSGATDVEQRELCDAYELLGPDLAYTAYADAWGDGGPSFDQFRQFFDGKC